MRKITQLTKKLTSFAASAALLGSMFSGTAFAEPSMPDLEITAITLGGTTLEIHLKNNGSSLPSDTEGSLYIWIDGSSRPEWTYSFSTLNDKNFLLFGGNSILGPQQLKGSHEVIACMDQTNLIAESNEANNCVVANVNGGMSLPDLRINSVTFNSSNVLSHLQMSVEIENIGKKDAVVSDGKLGLWYEAIDQGAAGFFELTGKDNMILSAGQRKTYTIPFNSLEAATDVLGSYNRFLFIVDQSSYINVADRMDGTVRKSEIDEANEANNSFVVQIVDGRTSNQSIVGPFHNPVRIAPYTAPAPSNSGGATTTNNAYVQPPDFTVDTIYLEFDTLKVDVRGGSPTPVPYNSDGKIYIWIDDMANPVWTYAWKTLTDNQFLQGNGKHSLITPQALYGNHRVKACVDAENDVEESHEENNCLTVNLRGNPVPATNTNSSGACNAPYVLYQGVCTDPIPACQNPPAHFLPSSCIDKIENGQYIERYNFQCENGYVRSGNQCVRTTSRTETNGPDLKIISAEVLPYNASYGDEYGFDVSNVPEDRSSLGVNNMALRVTVKNVGDADAYSPYDVVGLWVKFLRADEDYGWKELSTKLVNGQNLFVEKGATRTFTFNIPSQVNNGSKEVYYIFPGNNSIELTVDSTGYIAESNESNNTYTVKFEADAEKTAPKNSGLKYSVDLTSNPESYPIDEDGNRVFDSIWSEVKAEKGDKIIFTRHVNNQNAVNDAWNWNVESMLDCAPYPDFDSPDLRCTVVKEGLSKVSVTMFPVTADGKQYTVNSNTIYVTTGAKNSAVVNYTGSNSARTDGTVSVPPAGFEKDVQVGTQTQNNPFSDTNMATVAGKAAAALYNYGIIGGFPDGEFKGARSVNRAEAAKFLLLSRYESVPDNTNNGYFYDVLNGEWYTKYVITAAGLGIIGGYGDGTFRPADTVNTAEFLKMLTLTFELETGLPYSFTDVDGNAWYAQYVGIAAKYNLFPDRGSRLEPARLLTRNEVAVAIYQYLSNRD